MPEPENTNKKLQQILEAVKDDPNGLEQFGADPVGFLTRKGIDFAGLTLNRNSGEVTDADLAMVAGGGCGSIGYYSCYSEGD
jgi:hypothetical protein